MINFKKIADFKVHPIGIGTWAVGGRYKPNYDNDELEVDAIRYSILQGQNHIDCAEMYASGHSEELVGQAIKDLDRKKLFIASKVYKFHKNKDDILWAIEKMLKRLKTDYLDIVYIHSSDNIAPIEVYLQGLNKACDKKLVKYLGVSKFDLRLFKKALLITKHPIVAIQNHYNINNQQFVSEALKNFCVNKKITIVAHSPLENCIRSRVALELCEKYKKTPYQIALNWLISQENVVTIPKSTNKHHINENLQAMNFVLNPEDKQSLNSLEKST